MTLFLPDVNYSKSYASVARQISVQPAAGRRASTATWGAQRASFAYYGHLPFANVNQQQCDVLLLQDSIKGPDSRNSCPSIMARTGSSCGRAAAPPTMERFRLYQRIR
jgi:hypothetical protein